MTKVIQALRDARDKSAKVYANAVIAAQKVEAIPAEKRGPIWSLEVAAAIRVRTVRYGEAYVARLKLDLAELEDALADDRERMGAAINELTLAKYNA